MNIFNLVPFNMLAAMLFMTEREDPMRHRTYRRSKHARQDTKPKGKDRAKIKAARKQRPNMK